MSKELSILTVDDESYTPRDETARTHISNKSNPHGVTKSQVGLGNVENKSGATIRSEVTSAEMTSALGKLSENTSDAADADLYIAGVTANNATTYYKRTHTHLWNWIASKISSVLGLTKDSYGGKATSATKLATARTLTVGSTGKTFDGSGNVSWTLKEIGAQASGNYPVAAEVSSATVLTLFTQLRGKPGQIGSANLAKMDSGTGSAVAAGWYNYIFIPHRTGTGGDNPNYATILLFPMTGSQLTSYIVQCYYNATSSKAQVKYCWPIITSSQTLSDLGIDNVKNYDQSKAIKSITRSGKTFTATCLDGSTFTFDQQDNNTTYSDATQSSHGLLSKADKVKLDGIAEGATKLSAENVTLSADNWTGTSTPYSYDLGSAYANKYVILGFDSNNGSSEQLEAAQYANIQGGTGTTIYAYGDKPSVDIPVVIQHS